MTFTVNIQQAQTIVDKACDKKIRNHIKWICMGDENIITLKTVHAMDMMRKLTRKSLPELCNIFK